MVFLELWQNCAILMSKAVENSGIKTKITETTFSNYLILLSFEKSMVGAAGFELATPCTPCKCATRLRYAPTKSAILA